MSYGLMVWLVDPNGLGRICGGRDQATLHRVLDHQQQVIKSLDSELADELLDGGRVGLAYAISDLIHGTRTEVRGEFLSGACYGYALEVIVDTFFPALRNDLFYPAPQDWITEKIDPELRALGAPVTLLGLTLRGSPVPLPVRPHDFPSIGYWTAAECDVLSGVLPGPSAPRFQGTSEEVRTIRKWAIQACDAQGMLVGFYH